jgi:hypothetical protein
MSLVSKEKIMAENETPITETPVETPVEATTDTTKAVEDVKEEVDKRDDAILEELRNIHNAINAQTEHHIRHLENHTVATQAPVQETATEVADETLPDEPVSLQIETPKDMQQDKKEEKKRRKAHGRKR